MKTQKTVIVRTLLLLCLSIPLAIRAQDGCTFEPSGKIQKLLDQSFDMKKYETNERIEFLEKALDEDPKCTP
jgi:hypothetical protein